MIYMNIRTGELSKYSHKFTPDVIDWIVVKHMTSDITKYTVHLRYSDRLRSEGESGWAWLIKSKISMIDITMKRVPLSVTETPEFIVLATLSKLEN